MTKIPGASGLPCAVVCNGGPMREAVERDERGERVSGERVNRRRFLRRGAITAAVAASGAAVLSQPPAGAADGDFLKIDNPNTGSADTTVTGSKLAVTVSAANAVAIEASSTSGAQVRLTPNTIDVVHDTTHTFTEGSLIADSTNQALWYTYAPGNGDTAGLYPLNGSPVFLADPAPQRVYDSRPGFSP